MRIAKAVKISATGVVFNGPCTLCGFLLGTDGVNDPTIGFYNGTSLAGDDVMPTTTFEASTYGLSGFMPGDMEIDCPDGLYATIANLGTGECIVYVRAL